MKTKLIKFISPLLFLGLMFNAQAAETFKLDPSHTYVLWHIDHFGFSSQAGKWMASGTLVLGRDQPEKDKLDVTVKIADVVTGIKELNKHLKSPLFFDATKYPLATFVSDKVTITGKNTAKVGGMLTLHGVTKPLTLDVTLLKEGVNPVTNQYTAGFRATATIHRSEFNMGALAPGLSDKVEIEIGAEANRVDAK